MFLTISTTGTPDRPATDLGFLLYKHPGKAQSFATSHGLAHVVQHGDHGGVDHGAGDVGNC